MRALALLLAVMLPTQAFALSCMRPSVERTYAEASAAAETYLIVEGQLTLDAGKLPKSGAGQRSSPETVLIPARLRGRSLSVNGFRVPFNQTVTLEVSCFGPWCGTARNGEEVLAFLRRDAGAYALSINPCGGFVFPTPKPAMLKQALRCFQKGGC